VTENAPCVDCGGEHAATFLGENGPLCDTCFDARISAATGYPRLPAAPGPVTFTGPDGRAHRMRLRLVRNPGGIAAEAVEEPGGDADSGYRLEVLGPHGADPHTLLDTLTQHLEREIATLYLTPSPLTGDWSVAGTQVAGRLSEDEHGESGVVIDGRRLSWEQFGRALGPLDGWEFRICFGPHEPA
jgi:hypothetical protein